MPRRTRQGEILRSILKGAERPLTPAEIHGKATARMRGIGLATTYRHIRALVQEGNLVGVDYPGQPARYEWADGQRKIHFGCRSCDKLFALKENLDFVEPEAPELPPGFKVGGGEWILYGLCPECSQKEES
ncbi:MAG: transcriptional repressor [Opitutales bacterium]